ncbi:MAG: peptidylprolyl isomerase [Candidatus Nanopelagicales bacterium]
MSGIKRQKQLAREKFERQEHRRTELAAARRKRQRHIAIIVVLVVLVGALGWVLVSRTGNDSSATADASGSTASAEPTGEAEGSLDCAAPGTPRGDTLTWSTAPSEAPAPGASLLLNTNCGDIAIALDPAAPQTIASEAFLAGQGFYDNTSCHRLTTEGIFVLQCGDPRGNGKGGPGYTVPDENLPTEVSDGEVSYPAGTVAMANAGPGTSGSQFFIVYQDTVLPADYSIWGRVTSGLEMVQEIASLGVVGGASDGAPSQPVFIESASVKSA